MLFGFLHTSHLKHLFPFASCIDVGCFLSKCSDISGTLAVFLYVIAQEEFVGSGFYVKSYDDNITWKTFHLTHRPQDKMAAISQTIFWDAFLWMKSFIFFIKISLEFDPKGPIDNNPALV